MLPVYRHPTLVVFVDDSRSFLDSLTFQLGSGLEHKSFYDAVAALNWLRQTWRQHAAGEAGDPLRVGFDEESAVLERRQVSIFVDRIYRVVTDKRRFSLPSVLVVDYAMPQMDGLKFCAEIKELPIKKILLTGQADEKVAVEAFNRGLIDCYIRKNDPAAMERLGGEIARLQGEFFIDYTRTLQELLARHSFSFLSDPAMEALVEDLSARYRFVEYYLFPNPPGILFLDKQGKTTLMVVETAAGLTTQYEIAEDQGAPPGLLAALRDLKLVPFFSDTGGMYLREVGDNWLSYCLPPQLCQGRVTYYWALFDLPARYLQGPVYSQDEFAREQASRL